MSCLSAFGSSAGQTQRGLENERIVTGWSCHCGEMIVRTAGCGGHSRRRGRVNALPPHRVTVFKGQTQAYQYYCFERTGIELRVEGCECLIRFVNSTSMTPALIRGSEWQVITSS